MSKEQLETSVDRETIRLFWRAGQKHRRLFLTMCLNPVGAIIQSSILPLLIGKILASLAQPHGNPMQYIPWFVGIAAVGTICNRYGFLALLAHQAEVMSDLQARAFTALMRRSMGFHQNTVGGKLVSDVIDFQNAYSQLAGAIYGNIVPFALSLVTGIIVVFSESWLLGLTILFIVAFTIISGIRDSKRREGLRRERLKTQKAVASHLADTILNIFTAKTFAREKDELNSHRALNAKLRQQRKADWRIAGVNGNNRIILLTVMQLGLILVIIHLVHQNPSLLGMGIFAFSFTILLANRLFEINNMMRNIEEGLLQASPMTTILGQEPEIQDAPQATELAVSKGVITLQDVTFRYQEKQATQEVFDKLSLRIKPGEKVGLVGPSGGGKTTLTRLLLRFSDIDSGVIAIDGQNVAEVTQSSLRQAISYVPQEPLLFHRSIRENIAYGKPDATDEQIQAAAESAHAHEFIKNLVNGYDTIVGERGVKLSGGQRQRVAIARAILKDAPILVLDEATSALDSESEVLIQEALWKLMQGRTTLVIAHRLSTIQRMDRILVLEDGAITESGTHQELLTHKGTYAKLWKHQSGGFIEE